MRRPAAITALLAAGSLFAAAATAPAQPLPTADGEAIPTLTVGGEATVRVAPDRAMLTLGATAQADEAQAAQEQVNQVIQRALEAVTELGVPRDQIQTQQVMLHPVYSQRRPPRPMREDEPEAPEIVGYRASSVLEIRLQQLDRVGRVLTAAVDAGANEVQGIRFDLQDQTPQEAEALQMAIERARQKAEAMAGALGLELGPVLSISEGGAQAQPMRYMGARAAMMEAGGAAVEPGEVSVGAAVTLVYRLGETQP